MSSNSKEKSERVKGKFPSSCRFNFIYMPLFNPEFNLLLQPQFADFSCVDERLFLTGIGGMTLENLRKNGITHIINCTLEAPNWRMKGVESIRVAVRLI